MEFAVAERQLLVEVNSSGLMGYQTMSIASAESA